MRIRHRLLIVALCCAALAWIAGPAGRLLVVLPLLLFGPGYLFERAWAAFEELSLALRPALWLGLSISLVALIYEWATWLGLALTAPALSLLAAICGVGVAWRLLRERATDDRRPTTDDRRPIEQRTRDQRQETRDETGEVENISYLLSPVSRLRDGGRWSVVGGQWSFALLAILGLIFWTRFSQIEGLALPPWVDSVHHALMIRIAAETGQAPTSLRPYMPVDQLPYHWGYHVLMAAVMQLTGLTLGPVMLWAGQVLNALQALTTAALAAYLWRRPLAGVVAALVVGLLSIMPAYYLSWGRYTQLTGLLLLPPLAIAWRELLRAPSRGRLACLAVLLAGLSLVHFRVLVFALAYMAASGAIWAFISGWRTESPRSATRLPLSQGEASANDTERFAGLRRRIGYTVAGAVLALALAAPWLWMLALRTLLPAFERPGNLVAGGSYNAVSDGLLWAGHNRALLALALAAALWGVARRRRAAAEQALWIAALALLANPTLLGLPYTWLITNDVLVISLFLPVGVLIGGGASWLVDSIERRWVVCRPSCVVSRQADAGYGLRSMDNRQRYRQVLLHAGVIVALAGLALWGAWELRSVVNPDTILATKADEAAIEWAAEHTPADAHFLVGVTPWLNVYRGTDGGWWLLPLAGRWTSVPPVLYVYGAPDYVRAVGELSKAVANLPKDQKRQVYDLIERERITHIYLGPHSGSLAPETFAGDSTFEKVYERDGVTILAVHR